VPQLKRPPIISKCAVGRSLVESRYFNRYDPTKDRNAEWMGKDFSWRASALMSMADLQPRTSTPPDEQRPSQSNFAVQNAP
jgi:hypothetical protein